MSLPLLVRRGSLLLLLCALVVLPGCSLWTWQPQPNQSKRDLLPHAKMSDDSVVIEIAFVHVSPQRQKDVKQLWREVDEQHLPTDLRRRLAANGLRCGLVGLRQPMVLQRLLEDAKRKHTEDGGVHVDSEANIHYRRLQSRAGKRSEILASKIQDRIDLLTCKDGSIQGRTFKKAQCLFAIKTYPQKDGRVRIELVPEVHHGVPKASWIGMGGEFRQVVSRDHQVFDSLRIDTLLSLGQTLIIAGTGDQKGLGRHFFTERQAGDSTENRLLLIRIAQTQRDDLFDPQSRDQ